MGSKLESRERGKCAGFLLVLPLDGFLGEFFLFVCLLGFLWGRVFFKAGL